VQYHAWRMINWGEKLGRKTSIADGDLGINGRIMSKWFFKK